jgi:FMN phosphatase YigB (HAD superfamily)
MKNVIFDIGGVLFNYNKYNVISALKTPNVNPFQAIEQGHTILHHCYHHKSDNIKLYVLSNWNRDFFNLLTRHHKNTFDLFDGIVISGDVGVKKPDKRIYEYLIDKYKLDVTQSIFIDDQYENIQMAEFLGMNGIFCNDFETVKNKIKLFLNI